ncbi:threonine/serine dehydratase [Stackebrandtia soli]|uniref:threonine/serine dehydratase n=1 Tax=Stackebrandtia soli TaxID=1892856 RepID=UPI0039E8EF19
MITTADVTSAAERVAGHVRRTPVLRVGSVLSGGTTELTFKCEFTQHTGSFKARGATNRVLAALAGPNPPSRVVAASGGNAGLAVAYVAARQGLPATVYVPTTAPAVKVAKLRTLGATVHQVGAEYSAAYEAALADADAEDVLFCHAYDQAEICAGQGTLALELLDQLDGELDTVVVSVGGGGLMAGIVAASGGRFRVVAVEPCTIPTLATALDHGAPVDVDVSGVAADSLGARRIGDIAFALARASAVRSVLVEDAEIVAARRHLWDEWRMVVEHGTAAAWAALTTGHYRPEPGERVAVILCGANTDPSDLMGE